MNPTVLTADGVALEAIVDRSVEAVGSIVVCHPHPTHGGTMRHPMLIAIVAEANRRHLDAVRFNFRGVGGSGGAYGGGESEVLDVDAAVDHAGSVAGPVIGIVGWSFGAAIALVWQARSRSEMTYVGIAPPVHGALSPTLPPPNALLPADRAFIVGGRDQFVDPDELEAYGVSIGATIIRYETADHFFLMRHDRLATDVIDRFVDSRG